MDRPVAPYKSKGKYSNMTIPKISKIPESSLAQKRSTIDSNANTNSSRSGSTSHQTVEVSSDEDESNLDSSKPRNPSKSNQSSSLSRRKYPIREKYQPSQFRTSGAGELLEDRIEDEPGPSGSSVPARDLSTTMPSAASTSRRTVMNPRKVSRTADVATIFILIVS